MPNLLVLCPQIVHSILAKRLLFGLNTFSCVRIMVNGYLFQLFAASVFSEQSHFHLSSCALSEQSGATLTSDAWVDAPKLSKYDSVQGVCELNLWKMQDLYTVLQSLLLCIPLHLTVKVRLRWLYLLYLQNQEHAQNLIKLCSH